MSLLLLLAVETTPTVYGNVEQSIDSTDCQIEMTSADVTLTMEPT